MTNHREYTALVDAGNYPEEPAVPLDAPILNVAGGIHNLLTGRFTHAALITSRGGSVRANHYHQTDWHYNYVVSGGISYFWRPAGSKEKLKRRYFGQGKMFFSPPMVEHAMFFEHDTVFFTFARNERSIHETHESDLVRVPLIRPVWSWQTSGNWLPEVIADESLDSENDSEE